MNYSCSNVFKICFKAYPALLKKKHNNKFVFRGLASYLFQISKVLIMRLNIIINTWKVGIHIY